MHQRLLTIAAASDWLGMSQRALRARIWRKQVPIVRVGGRVYLDREALNQWIAANSVMDVAQQLVL